MGEREYEEGRRVAKRGEEGRYVPTFVALAWPPGSFEKSEKRVWCPLFTHERN